MEQELQVMEVIVIEMHLVVQVVMVEDLDQVKIP